MLELGLDVICCLPARSPLAFDELLVSRDVDGGCQSEPLSVGQLSESDAVKIPHAHRAVRGEDFTLAKMKRLALGRIGGEVLRLCGPTAVREPHPFAGSRHRVRVISRQRSPRPAQLENLTSLGVKH